MPEDLDTAEILNMLKPRQIKIELSNNYLCQVALAAFLAIAERFLQRVPSPAFPPFSPPLRPNAAAAALNSSLLIPKLHILPLPYLPLI